MLIAPKEKTNTNWLQYTFYNRSKVPNVWTRQEAVNKKPVSFFGVHSFGDKQF